MSEFTHFDEHGASRMVDVGDKKITTRTARAVGQITMQPETLTLIQNHDFKKGNVLEVARLAGIMASKKTADLIPLCHTLPLESAKIHFEFKNETTITIEATVRVQAKTGVEMEALTAVSIAALTIYDMCKSKDRSMKIESIHLIEKTGGKSGHYLNEKT